MEKEMTMRLREMFSRCRSWIDNEKYIPKKFKIKSRSDEFAESIVRELENVMIREKFSFRCEKIYLPTLYHIQISQTDSYEFAGIKRDVLCRELNNFVAGYLRLLSIEAKPKNFIRIEANSQLKKGEIKITHQWEECSSPEIIFCGFTKAVEPERFARKDGDETVPPAFWKEETTEIDDDYETFVGKKLKCLYKLDISRKGAIEKSLSIFQKEITIGRGSPTRPVDVGLSDDLEVSRHHALLSYQSESAFNLSIIGQNAAFTAQRNIFTGETINLTWSDVFQIGDYSLSIQR